MMAVATKVEAPIKLEMPHLSVTYPTSTCSIIGLGDIVIPGIFIGFLIRYGRLVSRSNLYTIVPLTAYTLSLLLCGICMLIWHQGQPALLYICPSLLISTLCLGKHRSELTSLIKGFKIEDELNKSKGIKVQQYELTDELSTENNDEKM